MKSTSPKAHPTYLKLIRKWLSLGLLSTLGAPAFAATLTWTTGDGGDGLWSNTANWGGSTLASGDSLVFGSTTGTTTLNNDLTAGTAVKGFTFNSDAPAYTIGGNSFNLSSTPTFIVNSASNITQKINTSFLNLTINTAWTVSGIGNLEFGGAIQNTPGWQGNMQMNGSGVLTFSGAVGNAFNLTVNTGTVVFAKTGGVAVIGGYRGNNWNGGTVKLGAANQSTGPSIYLHGSTVDLNGFDFGSASTNGLASLLGEGGVITNNGAGTGTNTLYSTAGGGFSGSSYGGTIKDGATAKVALALNRGRFILSGNNTFSGGVTLSAATGTSVLGIADMRSAGTSGSRNLTFSGTTNESRLQLFGTGITSLSGFNSVTYGTNANVGFDIQDSANTFTLGTVTNGTGKLTKYGAGTVLINAANTYTGATTIGGGNLKLDYQAGGTLASTSALTISGGGTLYLLGKTSGATAQTLGSVTVNAGGGNIVVDASTGSGTTLALGTVQTFVSGSTLDIKLVGSGNTVTTTTSTLSNGLLGFGRVAFRDAAGNIDFATTSGAGANRLIGAASYTGGTLPVSGGNSTLNYSHSGNASVTTTESINALKLTTSTTGQSLVIDAGQTLTLTSGGLLFTGADAYSITGGTLKSNTATNSDLFIHQYGAGNLTIGSEIANGVGSSTLTKAGTGALTLSGINTYTGQTYVSGGTLSINNNNQLGAVATGATLNLHGGTLQATADVTLNNGGSNSRAITIGSSGGGFDVTGANTLTVTGQINAQGQITKSGTGTLTLSNENFVWGGLRIEGGTVKLNNANALSAYTANNGDNLTGAPLTFGASGTPTLQLNNNNTQVLSLVGSSNAIVENAASTTNATITVYNGADNTFEGILRDGTGTKTLALAKTGGGTLTLSNASNAFSGGLTIYNGILEGTQAGTLGSGTITLADGTLKATGAFTNAIDARTNYSNNSAYTSSFLNNTIDTSGGNASFSGVLSGSGALKKTGGNTLTLSHAANTYTGTLTASAGTVSFASMGATAGLVLAGGNFTATGTTTVGSLGVNSSGGIVNGTAASLFINSLTGSGSFIANGTQYGSYVSLSGNNTGFSGSITANGNFVLGSEAALGTNTDALTLNGALTDNGSGLTVSSHRITLSSGQPTLNGNMNLTGGLTGAGGITVRSASSGAIVVGGTNNDFAGGVNVYTDSGNNSTLRMSAANTLPSGTGKGNLQLTAWNTGNAVLDLNGNSQTVNGLISAGTNAATRTIIDNVTAGGNVTLTVGAGNATGNTFAGIIRNTTGTLSLTKTGSGTQTLTGANTYTGGTTINAGTLALSGSGSLSDLTAVVVNSPGSFDISGISSSEKIASLSGATGSTLKLGAKKLEFGDANDTSFAGAVESNTGGGVKKVGAGVFTLGASSYAGTGLSINISQGSLLTSANNLPSSTAFTLSGGALNTGTFSNTVGSLSVTSGSIIDFAGGGTPVLTFASRGTWSGLLQVWNWSGSAWSSGTGGQLRFADGVDGSLVDVSKIQFYSGAGTGLISEGGAFIGTQLVPVPEPGTLVSSLLLLGVIGFQRRRKSGSEHDAA